MQEAEEWRDIEGFEGCYQVSNCGRVRSLDRLDSINNRRQGKVLRPGLSSGYQYVQLHSGEQQQVVRIHALVSRAFIGERPTGYVVNHKDGDRLNNHADNLEYITQKENIRHAAINGKFGKLSAEQVRAIRDLVSREPSTNLDLLAEKLGTSHFVIRSVVNAKCYQWIPNKDGSKAVPLLSTYNRSLTVHDITSLQELGFTLPEIGRYFGVEYSTPYQILRRAKLREQTQANGNS